MKKLIMMAAGAACLCASASPIGFAPVPKHEKMASFDHKASKREAQVPVTPMITEPKGTPKTYNKDCAGTFVFMGGLAMYKDNFPATVYWDTNGDVYFYRLLSTYEADYYVKGTVSGNTITVPCNQTIDIYDGEDGYYAVNFGVLQTHSRSQDGNVYIDFEYAPEIESVTFTIGNDGSIKMNLPGEPFDGENPTQYVAGTYYVDDLQFAGSSDFFQDYTKLDLELVQMPEDADIKQYVYVDDYDLASIVDVAFYGDDLYIRGLTNQLPEATIRARIEGDKAIVDQNEYVGIYYDLFYIFTKVLTDNPDYDENNPEGADPFIFAPSDVGFQLTIDKDRNTIYADTEGVYLSFHCDEEDFLNTLGYFSIFTLRYQDTFAGTPANPSNLEYTTQWADQQGFNDFFFTLSNYSTAGTLLDVEKLYYKVFVNGEPVVFYDHIMENLIGLMTTVYYDVPVKTELLPYLFSNDMDIVNMLGNAFDVAIYRNDVETVGVQSVYFFDNEFTYSDILTLDVATGEVTAESGVEGVIADNAEKVSTEYYTLDGRRVANPDRGIYIKVDTEASGRKTVKKIAF